MLPSQKKNCVNVALLLGGQRRWIKLITTSYEFSQYLCYSAFVWHFVNLVANNVQEQAIGKANWSVIY